MKLKVLSWWLHGSALSLIVTWSVLFGGVPCARLWSFLEDVHFLSEFKACQKSVLFLALVKLLSFCSTSLFSLFYCLHKGGGHRKITIIIEDPVAGWQCSFTVLHHLTPPTLVFIRFVLCMLMNLSFPVLPSAHHLCLWSATAALFLIWSQSIPCGKSQGWSLSFQFSLHVSVFSWKNSRIHLRFFFFFFFFF